MKLFHQKTTLPNGLRVVTTPMPHTYSVGVGFYLSIGSRYEDDALAGASHFVEHMVFKGTARRPSPESIAAELEGHGGLFNASTGQESTVLWAKMPRAHLPLAVDVLADMLCNSLLQPGEVEKERRVILEEISASQDVPEELVGLLIQEITWPSHPLGRDVAGTPLSVTGLSRSTLAQFMAAHYAPQNTVVSIAGDVIHEHAVGLVQAALGDWQPTEQAAYLPAPISNGTLPQVALLEKQCEQVHLALHLPGLSRQDPDRYVLALLNVVLGEGMSSRLFVEIRERLGLAYSVDSYTTFLTDTGLLGVYAAVDPEQVPPAMEAILWQLRRLREEPLQEQDLHVAREYTKGRLLLGLEDTLSVAGWLGRQEVLGGEVLTVEDVLTRIDAVTTADVRRVAGRLMRGLDPRLALVGPASGWSVESLTDLLANGPLA